MSQLSTPDLDVVVIGAGFSGIYALHKLRNEMGLNVRVFEAGGGVGGTWYWNRYPGARCDSEAYIYGYLFDEKLWQEWDWSERYPRHYEVRSYLEHVAERFDLNRDISFNTMVSGAHFDEDASLWSVTTATGETVTARYVITGVGCLSAWNTPPFPGRESFNGEIYYTGKWPHHDVDLAGKRVGIIGTGATAVQAIPIIAKDAADLTVFQRTANYIVPANHGPVPADVAAARKQDYDGILARTKNSAFGMPFTFHPKPMAECTDEEIDEVLWEWWNRGGLGFMLSTWVEPLIDAEKNLRIGKFLADRIKEKVHDPDVADLLTPKGIQYGVKRIPLDSGYFETFNEPHVHLIDVKSNPIAEITPTGVKLVDGSEYELDVIVYATGFDSTTGTLNRIDIRGRGGAKLKDKWADGPRTYLGMSAVGFPNLLMCTGPQSPNVLSNMPVSIEEHVSFFAGIIAHMNERGARLIEPTLEAEDAWVEHNNAVINATLFPQADTTYMGANIPGKPRVFVSNLDMVVGYAAKLAEVAANDYEGFVLEGQPATV